MPTRPHVTAPAVPGRPQLQPVAFADLAGFAEADHRDAFTLFARHAAALMRDQIPLRPGLAADANLRAVCRTALDQPPQTQAAARTFFETHFQPFRLAGAGFVTGYYEPVLHGALRATADFAAPILGRPDDLITLAPGQSLPGLDPSLSAARRLADGGYGPYPERAAIEAGAIAGHAAPLVFLKDPVEVFFAQVQGSLRVALVEGGERRFTYAGRNGHPYGSIGRRLVETGEIPQDEIGMARVKAWIRAKGQAPGEAGRALMQLNRSEVFFAENPDLGAADGPIGAAGLSLMPLRSIAIDRTLWPYGLPFWLAGDLPWQSETATPFRRLMIAGDTGSAIVGAARADIFFGSGDAAGGRAGEIRHACDFAVLLPSGDIGTRGETGR